MSEDEFNQRDYERFMIDQFRPLLHRFDQHMDADEKRFESLNVTMNRISTSIETQTAVQQALLSQNEKNTNSVWTRVQSVGIWLAPAIMLAIWLADRVKGMQ